MERLVVIIILAFVCLPCLTVYNGYGEVGVIDAMTAVGNQTTDISYGSVPDGAKSGTFFENPARAKVSLASAKTIMLSINEFMADNKDSIQNPAKPGSFDDWIELYNAGSSAVNLGGMYLTDKLSDPTQWRIPAGVTIPSGGYLLFWADENEKRGNTHTNFKLSKSGEEIGLFDTDGVTVIDSVTFDAQITDVSYGRYPNGMSDWGFMKATPGAANNPPNTPPKITDTMHTPELPTKFDPVWVTSSVTDDGGTVDGVTLTYQAAGAKPVTVKMYDDGAHRDTGVSDGIFGVSIPALTQDSVVHYSITATDNVGAKSTAPATAPALTFSYVVGYIPPQIYINEFMADSNAVINTANAAHSANAYNPANASNPVNTADPANAAHTGNGTDATTGTGGYGDWIELYNAGASSINLGGMYLTDNLSDPTQWQIPEGVIIPPDGYLLFWADGNNEQSNMHTSFKLDKSGEAIGLFDTDAKGNQAIDTVTFGNQTMNIPYGRIYDSGAPWIFFENPTPGSPNYFPAGTHNFVWKFSSVVDSYTVIKKFSDSVSAIKSVNTTSGQWELAYPLWGNPSGVNFPIRPECNYIISITSTSPHTVSFKGSMFGK